MDLVYAELLTEERPKHEHQWGGNSSFKMQKPRTDPTLIVFNHSAERNIGVVGSHLHIWSS